MFWISAILGVIACAVIIAATVMFLAAARRVRKRYEQVYLKSPRGVPREKEGRAA